MSRAPSHVRPAATLQRLIAAGPRGWAGLVPADRAHAGRAILCAGLVALAGGVVFGLVRGASAGDNAGVHAFWNEQSAAQDGVQRTALRGTVEALSPVTIRRRVAEERVGARHGTRVAARADRRRHAHTLAFGPVPSKPAVVSIYEDRTLRPGDAVMMEDGMRIFTGGRSWPYGARDFMAVKVARGLDRHLRRTLVAMDGVPRG